MKYRYLFLSVFVLFSILSYSQNDADNLATFQEEHLEIQKKGMLVLGAWAVSNFAASGYSMTQTSGVPYYFHQMNVFWNTVNIGLAVSGYLGATNPEAITSTSEMLMKYNSFSKILLFNAGLDVAYMTTGLYLRERSKNISKQARRFKGYGNSLLLQGGFLFAFDLVLFLVNESSMNTFLENSNLQVNLTPGYFSVTYVF
jgi:hypothetical protein